MQNFRANTRYISYNISMVDHSLRFSAQMAWVNPKRRFGVKHVNAFTNVDGGSAFLKPRLPYGLPAVPDANAIGPQFTLVPSRNI